MYLIIIKWELIKGMPRSIIAKPISITSLSLRESPSNPPLIAPQMANMPQILLSSGLPSEKRGSISKR
jgi:hypothetical protein